jgi:hypothetical protein
MEQQEQKIIRTSPYTNMKIIEGKGLCGLQPNTLGVTLFYGIEKDSIEGGYAYKSYGEAINAINKWGCNDEHPPGNWIIHTTEAGTTKNPNYNLQ